MLIIVGRPQPEPKCHVDQDCPLNHLCTTYESCQDPCRTDNHCRKPQRCEVKNTYPKRSVVCRCPIGTSLGSNGECVKGISYI